MKSDSYPNPVNDFRYGFVERRGSPNKRAVFKLRLLNSLDPDSCLGVSDGYWRSGFRGRIDFAD